MGYTTTFEGEIKIEPPLTDRQAERLNAAAEAARDDGVQPTRYATNCDWRVYDHGSAIRWDESEKFYDAAAWMVWMISQLPDTRTANGAIAAEGEEPGDQWRLRVVDGKVFVDEGKVAYAESGTPLTID
ncbi:MAG TPA: hypothetical protein VMW08_00230 [Acidimicrobiales bacterium]|nr:hypothetical protein [Acidimicrobiales bacterium]